ncbi:SDR family NAD(P)-dependent oxidoreductase [Streptomyces gobiensis]|uniref:SDR family NAD(P)-dependent oxidoreductase n=1 Tax=Streptomyces gobiensis TaxID=2875706 RepID=UPI001E3092B7|nr:SDR family NAD(P)-dependent oxidoreductase [Streptomyces gobiensis]UGY92579.1 SDR family NAD(P)-dependent oxidoreductase [Streptomyces gobiensis]
MGAAAIVAAVRNLSGSAQRTLPDDVAEPDGIEDPLDGVEHADHIRASAAAPGAVATPRDDRATDHGEADAVAVVGMGVVVPGAGDPKSFWALLLAGQPAFSEPGDRFPLEYFWSPDTDAEDRTYSRHAGYIRQKPAVGVNDGDHVSCWLRQALLQCGAARLTVGGQARSACFIGGWNEGSQHVEESAVVETAADGIAARWPGTADDDLRDRLRAALRSNYPHAGRVTRHLPLAATRAAIEGLLPADTPVQVVDTACSSSLFAIDLGVKSLLVGDCDVAFCGGAHSFRPRFSVEFAKLQGLSRSGRVLAFDPRADGVLFADGAGLVALKRLSRARADGDRVLAVLAGFGAASDGRGKAIYAPNATGQERALARARAVNSVAAGAVDWVVAHGTGTPAGDAVERNTLHQAAPPGGLLCTSNKSLVGHTGWSAGVVSVVHALLGLAHDTVPAQRPCEPAQDTHTTDRVRIPIRHTSLPRRTDRPRTVGVSSFGFGGTNAHLLLQDEPAPAATPPRALPPILGTEDEVVIVDWTAHLPGIPDAVEIRRRLAAGLPPAEQRSFSTPYPVPPLSGLRLPPRTTAAMDRSQLMALQAAGRLTGPADTALWDGLEETSGVFAAFSGLPVKGLDANIRCYADSLRAFAESAPIDERIDRDALRSATEAFISAVRSRAPATGEDSLPGLMPNIIAARIANHHDLHGPTMTLDTGTTSGRTALRTAERYLRHGELDLALVIGVSGGSEPLYAQLHELSETAPAEGAFLIALARVSTARDHAWPVLEHLSDALVRLPKRPQTTEDRTYLAADDLMTVIKQLPAEAASGQTRRKTSRYLPQWHPAGPLHAEPSGPILPSRTLIIADPASSTVLRPMVRSSPFCHLLAVRADDDLAQAVGDALSGTTPPFQHVRVVASLHGAPSWPSLAAVQEATFLAVQALHGSLNSGGSLATTVLTPFVRQAPHPYASLLTGLAKSLAWEMTGCTVTALLTDTREPTSALKALAAEAERHQGFPVVMHNAQTRLVQRLSPRKTPPGTLPLEPGAVVVVTGGARGITAACMLGLARRMPLKLWLLGSSRLTDVPAELLDATDDQLPAQRARYISEQRANDASRSVRDINAAFNRLLNARESQRNLLTLRGLCGADSVHFLTCDVTDPTAVETAANHVRVSDGHVDLLVHGAGLHYPGEITRLDTTALHHIRDVKVKGYHHLRAAFSGTLAPSLWCNFGSMASVMGLPGESIYAPPNDFLAAAAEATGKASGEFTIAWTLWGETGLGTGPISDAWATSSSRLTKTPTDEGVAHFLDELSRQPGEPLIAFIGEAESRALHHQFPGFLSPPQAPVSSPAPKPSPPARGLLGPAIEKSHTSARWQVTFDLHQHPYLLDHVADNRPTVPGALLLALAAEAGKALAPGLRLHSLRDIAFTAFVRTLKGRPPTTLKITAQVVGDPATIHRAIAVTGCTDTTTPNGRVLARDREHFRATVLLGGPTAAPAPTGPLPDENDWSTVTDPYYAPDCPVRLSGIFQATERQRTAARASAAEWKPRADQTDAGIPGTPIPVTLLDALLRTPALHKKDGRTQAVFVPRQLARVTVYDEGDDASFAHTHPSGISLRYTADSGTCTALAADGRILAQVTGIDAVTVAQVPG